MKYGEFNRGTNEYEIYNPKLPAPWGNYLSNRTYTCLISHTAGGYSFYKDPRDYRLIRYRFNNVPADRPGRYIYLKEGNEYWSPMLIPLMKDINSYKCVHGLGYTRIDGEYMGLKAEVTYFVPLEGDIEIWKVNLKNNTDKKKEISLYSYVEFAFWNVNEDLNIQWVPNNVMSDYDNGLIYNKYLERHPIVGSPDPYYQGDRPGGAFLTMNAAVDSFEMDRDIFIGNYNSEDNPDGLQGDRLTNSQMRGGNACGALQTKLILAPGESKQIVVMLGYSETKEKGKELASKYMDNSVVECALTSVKEHWSSYISKFVVETPDQKLNDFFNVWNQYQAKVTFDWSRYASFWETGLGRGIGFRDTCQDTHGVIHTIPDQAKEKIELLLKYQLSTGAVYHVFFPHTGEKKMPEFSDDPLKIAPLVCHYIKETGDIGFLDKVIPYGDGNGSGTVYEHMCRALDFIYSNKGKHGIPLVLDADWNDTLLLRGPNRAAESIFIGALYCWASNELISLLETLPSNVNYKAQIELLKIRGQEIADAVNKNAWDGKWYIRAYDDNGGQIGNSIAQEGKIFLNPQSWCIVSGIANKERAETALESVKEYLYCDYGVKLSTPSYSKYNKFYGIITRYNLGTKENGGVFTQSNPWYMMALAKMGRGDDIYDVIKRINPLNRNDSAEIHKVEPYVYCQSIVSDENEICPGRASNSWLTGTAGASIVAFCEHFFGVKAELSGLTINPCIPSDWEQIKIKRVFRGKTYNIIILNKNKSGFGVKKICLNGIEINGNLIPEHMAENVNDVVVEL